MTPRPTAMARAIEAREFERVALYLATALARAARTAPQGTIDDVLALLSAQDERMSDDRRP